MSDNLLKNKRILITGINGFVGTHLASHLRSLGATVYGISHTVETSNTFKVNMINYSQLEKIVNAKKIQICFHLAGESLVETGHSDPYQTYKNNILGTLNVLELCRVHNLERVIIASTSHVYGKNRIPYYEGYTPRPTRPYETSKACIDLIATSYANTFNLPVLIPRFVNIYGPGDFNFTRIIPKTIKGILTEGVVTLWSGKAIRDYLYIDDAVDAYIKLSLVNLEKIDTNRIFNFGFGNPISVSDLINTIISISGKDVKVKRTEDKRPSEIQTQYVSFKKAQRLLCWKPHVSLESGLEKTFAWYSEYFSKH